MQPFELSRTESLLLGTTFAEYKNRPNWRFKEVLQRNLSPFVPTFEPSARTIQVVKQQIPSDIVWGEPFSAGERRIRVGYARSTPSCFFSEEGEEYSRTEWDHTRKSVSDLVLLFLGDAVALSRFERAMLPGDSAADMGRKLNELARHSHAPDLTSADSALENRDQIERRLLQLVRFNEHEQVFRLGEGFGVARRTAQHYEIQLAEGAWSWEPSEAPEIMVDDYVGDIIPLLKELRDRPEMGPCTYAADILKWEIDRLEDPSSFDVDTSDRDIFIDFARRTSNSLAFALGDVLATFRSADLTSGPPAFTAPSLRQFQLRGDSSEDRVHAAIALAEAQLSKPEEFHAVNVLGSIVNGIEALTKRLWAEELPADRSERRGLVVLLNSKQHSGTEREQRFASIALMLYKAYRNPVQHDLDSVRCTWNEVRFFVSGMRVLLELYEELKQRP